MAVHPRTAAPALVAGVTVLLSLATLVIALSTVTSPSDLLAGNRANQWLGGLAFGLVGALVLRAQPSNRLGVVIAASGITAALGSTATEYARLATDSGRSPIGWEVAAWASST